MGLGGPTASDGLLLVPLEHGGSHPLVKLGRREPDRLVGRIVAWSGFMRMRGDMARSGAWPSSPPDFGGRPPDEVLPLFPALKRALPSEPDGVDREVEWWRVPGAWYDFHFFLSLCDVRAYRGPEGLGLVDDDGGCAALVRPNGVGVWGRSGLYRDLETACDWWEQLGMPSLSSWEVELLPRTAGAAGFVSDHGGVVVERGRVTSTRTTCSGLVQFGRRGRLWRVPQGWREDLQRWALVGSIDLGAQMSGDVGREGRVAGWWGRWDSHRDQSGSPGTV